MMILRHKRAYLGGCFIANAIIAFFILGLIYGVLFDISEFFRTAFSSKFLVDFSLMVCFAFLFFIVQIAYNDGNFRALYLIMSISAFFLYYYTLHQGIYKVFHSLGKKINNRLKSVSKKLKIDDKSLKNRLHFNK